MCSTYSMIFLPLSGYITLCLFIHQLWTLGCFYFWVILNKAAKTFVYKCLCRHLFSVLVGIDLGVELLNHMGTMLVFNEMQDYFLKHHFTPPAT